MVLGWEAQSNGLDVYRHVPGMRYGDCPGTLIPLAGRLQELVLDPFLSRAFETARYSPQVNLPPSPRRISSVRQSSSARNPRSRATRSAC